MCKLCGLIRVGSGSGLGDKSQLSATIKRQVRSEQGKSGDRPLWLINDSNIRQ